MRELGRWVNGIQFDSGPRPIRAQTYFQWTCLRIVKLIIRTSINTITDKQGVNGSKCVLASSITLFNSSVNQPLVFQTFYIKSTNLSHTLAKSWVSIFLETAFIFSMLSLLWKCILKNVNMKTCLEKHSL